MAEKDNDLYHKDDEHHDDQRQHPISVNSAFIAGSPRYEGGGLVIASGHMLADKSIREDSIASACISANLVELVFIPFGY